MRHAVGPQLVKTPNRFIAAMTAQGLTAASAIRGLRLLRIRQVPTPELLSKPCVICAVRKRAPLNRSTWYYRPILDDEPYATASVIIACDDHMAGAVRAYTNTLLLRHTSSNSTSP